MAPLPPRLSTVLALTLILAGCGGDSTGTAPTSAAATVTSVTVTGGTPTVGNTVQFVATARMSNTTVQDVTTVATWQSSNPAVATVSATGSVRAVTGGTADITATYQGVRGILSITIALPAANIQITGQGSFTTCLSTGDCLFSASIQNVGVGCASGTAVVARFLDANGAQVGSDVQMGATGGLASRTIRPQEVVPITSVGFVNSSITSRTKTYRLLPTWNNVSCP